MKLSEWVQAIETVFPPAWALPDDPIGLHVGDPDQTVTRAMAALEVSTPLVERAARRKVNAIFAHHPLIYRPIRSLVESDPTQRLIRFLVRHDIALYAAHTNVDLHPMGMAKRWAERLGCVNAKPAMAKPQAGLLKIAVYVPPEHTDSLREAMSLAGAGVIGEYEHCSNVYRGVGTFTSSENANPYLGEVGKFEKVEEDRLEMVLPRARKSQVIRALYLAHPYEEPAYDLYAIEDLRDLRQALWTAEFQTPLSWDAFEERVSQSLPLAPNLQRALTEPNVSVQRIAFSTGSGNSLIPIVAGMRVDAYVTGELGYHNLWEAKERGLHTLVVGHDASESLFAETVIPLTAPRTEGVEWISEHEGE